MKAIFAETILKAQGRSCSWTGENNVEKNRETLLSPLKTER